ncbi:MAG: hypothetical protein KDB62_05800 [Solirubrobacterales bacterium]|nr:hypothetical protein [Solirubrobacterales bacterium]
MEFVWLALLGLAVAAFVSRPFWPGADPSPAEDPEIAALEAAREAKYREISDARADRDSGKLPDRDFEVLNAQLRAEAIAILDRLERAQTGGKRSRDGDQRAENRSSG